MKKFYGYGPTRNLPPSRMAQNAMDMSAYGNKTDIVEAVGALIHEKNSSLHTALVGRDADLFDGVAAFMTGMGLLNTNYGSGGTPESGLAAAFGTWLQTNHLSTYEQVMSGYPSAFASNTGLYDAIVDLLAKKAAYANAFAQCGTLMSVWNGMLASGAPLAMTPHAAGSNMTSDLMDLTTWMTALRYQTGDGIHVGTGDA